MATTDRDAWFDLLNLPDFETAFLGFYTVNFLCFSGHRVNIQGVSTDEATRRSVYKFSRNLQLSFFDVYYINVSVKFDDIFLTARERKSTIHVPIVKNIHGLGAPPNMRFQINQKPLFLVT